VVYLVGSLCVVLAFDIAPSLDVMYGLALAAELAVASRLLTKGVSSAESQRIPAVAGVALLLSACGGGSVFATDRAGCAVAVQNTQRRVVFVSQGVQI
jgi:K+ transporter